MCQDCNVTFIGRKKLDVEELWKLYRCGLSYAQIGQQVGVSPSTVKRKLRDYKETYIPPLLKSGVVHLDVTYWGRNKGLMLAIDSETGSALYRKWIGHERKQDYVDAIEAIESGGYEIKAIVLDGGVGLDICMQLHIVQMCQYHFLKIIVRKLTLHPKQVPSIELLKLARRVKYIGKEQFISEYNAWLEKWDSFLKEKTVNPDTDRWQYKHRALRSAARTFKEKLPFLYSYLDYPELNIPNTNNAIEGLFTDLKTQLRNHSGMSQRNRERYVDGFLRHRDPLPGIERRGE